MLEKFNKSDINDMVFEVISFITSATKISGLYKIFPKLIDESLELFYPLSMHIMEGFKIRRINSKEISEITDKLVGSINSENYTKLVELYSQIRSYYSKLPTFLELDDMLLLLSFDDSYNISFQLNRFDYPCYYIRFYNSLWQGDISTLNHFSLFGKVENLISRIKRISNCECKIGMVDFNYSDNHVSGTRTSNMSSIKLDIEIF